MRGIDRYFVKFPSGCIPRRLRRVRHSGGSRNPDVAPTKVGNHPKDWVPVFTGNPGFRIKCGMTEFKVFDTPLLAAG